LIVHYTHFEPFEPPSGGILGFFFLGALLTLAFNMLLNLGTNSSVLCNTEGIIWYSPLFMRIAVLCSIPLSFLVDLALGEQLNWIRSIGAVVIVVGFALFSFAADQEGKGTPPGGFVCAPKVVQEEVGSDGSEEKGEAENEGDVALEETQPMCTS
jgi:hypothetical protein